MTRAITLATERQFQDRVVNVAHQFGWLVVHHGGDQHRRAWYDTTGFPDLTLVHSARPLVWFRELKSDKGRLTPAQLEWKARLELAGHNFDVWRPRDLADIVAALSDGRARVVA